MNDGDCLCGLPKKAHVPGVGKLRVEKAAKETEPPKSPAAAAPCKAFKYDMAASAKFGDCVCGFTKSAHHRR